MATTNKDLIAKNNRNYYKKNKEKFAAFRDNRRDEIREWILKYKLAHPCPCGETHPATLQFHHRDPSEKDMEVSIAVKRQWGQNRLESEIAKCDVLCANCHLKLHYNERAANSIGRVADS